ncbi:universal stress protein [Nitratireductor sp. XY-223]|uniref:universal stress protein n=1 Tax=Nitratireductor sp. XY-223 TaxID=2561926 RepID=UPI00145B5131|nr:universal stress protein [Nitratireductor sp. XY-223]
MSITTLLAIHSTDDQTDNLKPVMALAEKLGAHLNLVVFGVLDTIPTATYPGIPAAYLSDEHNRVMEKAQQRANTVQALIEDANLSASVLVESVDRGIVGRTMSRHALCADLTVFPHGSIPRQALLTDAFNGVLFEADRPVLVLGEGDEPLAGPSRALMAWNGEPEAAAAIHQSLMLLEGTNNVHLVTVGEVEAASQGGLEDEMSLFLARHDKEVSVDRVEGSASEVADLLLAHASDKDADIIVMGAYGHSRLREWLLGGTTRDLLARTRHAVLMAH